MMPVIPSVGLRAAGALLVAAALFGAGYVVRGAMASAEMSAVKQAHAEERAKRAEAHASALTKVRAEEREIQIKLQEAQDAEVEKRRAAEVARRKSDAAAVGLRDELQATRAELDALKNDPSTAPGCKAAAEAGAMCTVLLGRCNDRRRELADFAESSSRAGDLCVRTYEALTPPGPPGP